MPPNLVAQTLRGGLYTRVVGRRVRYFHTLPSTMDEAARLAQEGAPEGTVVVAETQTASRGRFGRTWVSQPGNLYLSVVFRPGPDGSGLPLLPCLGALAVVRAIRQTTGLSPRLKWPNDVLLAGKKVAGVLAESAIQEGQAAYAVLGIGVNVSLEVPKSPLAPLYQRGERTTPSSVLPLGKGEEAAVPSHWQGEGQGGVVPPNATSLNAQAGREVPRDALLRHLLHALDRLYLDLVRGQSPLDQWRELLDTLGQRVTVTGPGGELRTGLAEGVDHLGNLLLRLDDGQVITVTSGDVTLS